MPEWKDTVNLPRTDFPMKANLPTAEPEWLARFQAEKKKLGFAVYAVLIDVGQSSRDTLAALSDRVTSVSTLTDDAVRDLFLKL